MSWIVVSLHDVAPTTLDRSCEWLRLLDPLGIRTSLLVIPGPWNGGPALDANDERAHATVAWIRQRSARGDEVVQHGWEHREVPEYFDGSAARRQIGSVLARGCAEFWCIPEAEARKRIHLGFRTLERVRLHPTGFVAPGWLMRQHAMKTLAACGLRHTSTHLEVRSLRDDRRWRTPALSQRPLSPAAGAAARSTIGLAATLIAMRRPLRLAVHPDDLVDRIARRAVVRIAEMAVEAGYRSTTYVALAERVPASGTSLVVA